MDAAPGEARGDVIPMYDELIEQLRETSIDFGEMDHVSVMMIEAANAIEELSHPQIAPEKIIQTMWIPVAERLPEDYEQVLTCDERGNIHIFSHFRHFRYPFGIKPEDPR